LRIHLGGQSRQIGRSSVGLGHGLHIVFGRLRFDVDALRHLVFTAGKGLAVFYCGAFAHGLQVIGQTAAQLHRASAGLDCGRGHIQRVATRKGGHQGSGVVLTQTASHLGFTIAADLT
jgi:hypothetical protein